MARNEWEVEEQYADVLEAAIIVTDQSISAGFNTDLDMGKTESWLKEWFDESVKKLEPVLTEQTYKFKELMKEHYGIATSSVEITRPAIAEDFTDEARLSRWENAKRQKTR